MQKLYGENQECPTGKLQVFLSEGLCACVFSSIPNCCRMPLIFQCVTKVPGWSGEVGAGGGGGEAESPNMIGGMVAEPPSYS